MATLYYRKTGTYSFAAWNTLANWFQDSAFTIPATSLPTSTDDAEIYLLDHGISFSTQGQTKTINNITFYGPTSGSSNLAGPDGATLIVNGNATFNRRSRFHNSTMTVNGLLTFNNITQISSNANITANGNMVMNGNAKIIGSPTSITGPTCTFNDNSMRYPLGGTFNFTNTIFNNNAINFRNLTSTVTFRNRAGQYPYGSNRGRVLGNAIFPDSTYRYSREVLADDGIAYTYGMFPIYKNDSGIQDSITGSITFSSVTPVTFNVGNTVDNQNPYAIVGWDLDSSLWTFSGGTPSWIFDYNGYMYSGNIIGNATFTGSTYYSGGTVGGNVVFSDSSYNNGALTLASGKTATFNNTSFNNKTINGTVVYNGLTGENNFGYFVKGEKYTFIKIPVIVSNTTIFNNKSACGLVLDAGALSLLQGNGYTNITYVAVPTITGNVSFKNSAINLGLITGNATFINRSENKSGISGTTTTTPDRGVNGSSILGVI